MTYLGGVTGLTGFSVTPRNTLFRSYMVSVNPVNGAKTVSIHFSGVTERGTKILEKLVGVTDLSRSYRVKSKKSLTL